MGLCVFVIFILLFLRRTAIRSAARLSLLFFSCIFFFVFHTMMTDRVFVIAVSTDLILKHLWFILLLSLLLLVLLLMLVVLLLLLPFSFPHTHTHTHTPFSRAGLLPRVRLPHSPPQHLRARRLALHLRPRRGVRPRQPHHHIHQSATTTTATTAAAATTAAPTTKYHDADIHVCLHRHWLTHARGVPAPELSSALCKHPADRCTQWPD